MIAIPPDDERPPAVESNDSMRSVLLLALLGVAPSAYAEDVVAVFGVEARGIDVDTKTRRALTEYAATLLATDGRYAIVPPDEIRRALMREKAASYRECYDTSCQIEIGKEIAANLTLSTTLSRIGSTCVLSMRLFDLRTAASVGAATARGVCSDDAFVQGIEKCVADLTGRTPPPVLATRTITVPTSKPRRTVEPVALEPRVLRREPLSAAQLLARDGRWSKRDHVAARVLARVAVNDPSAQYKLGMLYAQADEKSDDAIAAFDTLVRRWPRHEVAPRARRELARLHLLRADTTRARKAVAPIVDDEDALTALLVGEIEFAERRWTRAEKRYRAALEGEARIRSSARYRLAWIALRDRRDDEAITSLEEVSTGHGAIAEAARKERAYFCEVVGC